MIRKYGCAIAIALMAGGAAAGCGGDDEEEPLSKAEYIKQGDAICKKGNAELQKEADEMFKDLGENEQPSEEELGPFVEDVIKPNLESQLNDLRDLSPPEGDEDEVKAIYDKLEEGLGKVQDDPALLLSEDDPLQPATDAAGEYGFKECSK